MTAKTLMIQGTGSSVGKSVIATALCRIFRQDGLKVAPFKAQNMALNSFVTKDGGEMGRAQVVQAQAAGVEPSVDMNPILIKPEADTRAQVVVRGRPSFILNAEDFAKPRPHLWGVVEESLGRLLQAYDLVVIEGAGSPAEINLRDMDLVNMRVARHVQAPVLLVGDIDRGGVFASLVGTLALLPDEERELVKGFIINKFRGDLGVLRPGLDFLESHSARPVLGVVPYFRDILIPEEDSIHYREVAGKVGGGIGTVDIAVIHLPHISNSTDFEPLQQEEGVSLRYVSSREDLGQPDIIIIPGSKSTVADLGYLRERGLAEAILQRARSGVGVIGICGGYQMLGQRICDPSHVESAEGLVLGLGLLDVATTFYPEKTTSQVRAQVLADWGILEGTQGVEVEGYEIHMGETQGEGVAPAFRILERPMGEGNRLEGSLSPDGKVLGTYVHGLFDSAAFRSGFLSNLRRRKGFAAPPSAKVPNLDEHYDRLAEVVRSSLNMELVYRISGLR